MQALPLQRSPAQAGEVGFDGSFINEDNALRHGADLSGRSGSAQRNVPKSASYWSTPRGLAAFAGFGVCKDYEKPTKINTDKAGCYSQAIRALKKEGKCPKDTEHRQVKYLNNVIEADRGRLKQLIRPVRGFKTMKTAYATIKGFEVMRALRKGQGRAFNLTKDPVGEARMIERAFGLGSCAMSEAVAVIERHLAA